MDCSGRSFAPVTGVVAGWPGMSRASFFVFDDDDDYDDDDDDDDDDNDDDDHDE